MDWIKHSKSRAMVKLCSQPTGYYIFKYDEMAKEKLLLMEITCPNSFSSFHLAIIKSTVKCQRRKVFQSLKHKRNHWWQSTLPKYLLNQRGISAGNAAQREESDSTCQTIARRKQLASKYNTACVSIPGLSCVMLWGLSKKQCFLRRQLERNLDVCPSFPSLCINISTCSRRQVQDGSTQGAFL